jgi:hypothetical protein
MVEKVEKMKILKEIIKNLHLPGKIYKLFLVVEVVKNFLLNGWFVLFLN